MITLNVVCILDLLEADSLEERKLALEAIKRACHLVKANFDYIQVDHDNFDVCKTNVLDKLYSADVAVVDLSVVCQQRSLMYHVGIRESFDMEHTIILYNDSSAKATKLLRSLCSRYSFVSYRSTGQPAADVGQKEVLVTDSSKKSTSGRDADEGTLLHLTLQQLLLDASLFTEACELLRRFLRRARLEELTKILANPLMERRIGDVRAHMKEKFLADLRKAREVYSGADLKAQLTVLRKRLDDPNILSGDVVLQVLSACRDVEDYDAMVELVDALQRLPDAQLCTSCPEVLYLLAFALNRRNLGSDRERARSLVREALDPQGGQQQDMACLCARMHKDKFVESGHTDQESLKNAIFWYRKGFEDHPNEYAGINLATLLVIAGSDFAQSSELQHIALFLYNQIGKKGSLDKLEDYWDVATFFEISVLAEDYGKAVQAAEYMFKLKPPNWQLQSTMGNVGLIERSRGPLAREGQSAAQRLLQFWVAFFASSSGTPDDFLQCPVLLIESSLRPDAPVYRPSYISVCADAGEEFLQIRRLALDDACGECSEGQDLVASAAALRRVAQHEEDPRTVVVEAEGGRWQVGAASEQLGARLCVLLQGALLSRGRGAGDTPEGCVN